MESHFTRREREIIIRLLDLSKQCKEQFKARMLDPAATGPSRELARLDFGEEGHSVEVTKRDLRVLKDEGLIHFRWDSADHGTGRVWSHAYDAATGNFQRSDPGDAAALAADATKRARDADEKAIALRFVRITAEMVQLA